MRDGVSSSVSAITAALNSCLAILRNTRAKRQQRKARNTKCGKEDERRLDRSLTLGSSVIEEAHARGIAAFGQHFADGDAEACARLNKTLLELNAGLVKVIAAFLEAPSLDGIKVDYSALSALSDISRIDTQEELANLSHRLTRSLADSKPRLPLTNTTLQGRNYSQPTMKPGRKKNQKLSGHPGSSSALKKTTVRGRKKESQVSIAPYQSSGTARYALVRSRPRPHNLASDPRSSSSPLAKNPSSKLSKASPTFTATTTPCTSSSGSPNLRHDTETLSQAYNHGMLGSASGFSSRALKRPAAEERTAQPLPDLSMELSQSPPLPTRRPPQVPSKPRIAENAAITPIVQSTRIQDRVIARCSEALDTEKETQANVPSSKILIPFERRRHVPQRVLESIYSFQSDSTKIGEIPLHQYSVPLDFDEMKRLNALAGAAGFRLSDVNEDCSPVAENKACGKSNKKNSPGGLWSRIIRKKRVLPILPQPATLPEADFR